MVTLGALELLSAIALCGSAIGIVVGYQWGRKAGWQAACRHLSNGKSG